MVKITNTSAGPRGFNSANGEVLLSRGESWEGDIADGELESARGTGYFDIDGEGAEPGPLDRSVEDLKGHLATVTDADEVQALIDAETAGKSRKGALEALEARRDELLA